MNERDTWRNYAAEPFKACLPDLAEIPRKGLALSQIEERE